MAVFVEPHFVCLNLVILSHFCEYSVLFATGGLLRDVVVILAVVMVTDDLNLC